MTADLHTLTGVYATNALPADERQQFELHLAECELCSQEVRELQATAARLAAASPAVVPPGLRSAVLADVARTRQLPPLTPARGGTVASVTTHPRWWRSPLAAVAAVLLVACVGLGSMFAAQRAALDDARREAVAIAEIAADPDRRSASANVPNGGRVTVLRADDRAVVVAQDLPAVEDDQTYQLWLVGDAGVQSAGLLGERDGGVSRRLVSEVGRASAVAISVEPEGGSEQPTTKPVVAVELA